MNRMVWVVFKVLGVSIVLMLIMDVLFLVIDTVTVNNRVVNLASTMQNELARNNCIPDDSAILFLGKLNDIQLRSNMVGGIKTNLADSITINGRQFQSVSENNVSFYGEISTLVIRVEMRVASLLFYKNSKDGSGNFLSRDNFLSYNLTYIYDVPSLRFLK
jgi:hypothetical protein